MKLTFNKFIIGFVFAFVFMVFSPLHHVSAVAIEMLDAAAVDNDGTTGENIVATIDINKTTFAPGDTISLTASAYHTACSNSDRNIVATVRAVGVVFSSILNGTVGGGTAVYGSTDFNAPSEAGSYDITFNVTAYLPGTTTITASATYVLTFDVVVVEPMTAKLKVKINDGNIYESGSVSAPAGSKVSVWWEAQNADACEVRASWNDQYNNLQQESWTGIVLLEQRAIINSSLEYDTTYSITCSRATPSTSTSTTTTPTPTVNPDPTGQLDLTDNNIDQTSDLPYTQ